MIVRIGRRLRAAGVCLLGVAASLSASVPIQSAPTQPAIAQQTYRIAALLAVTPGRRFHASARTCPSQALTASSNSVTRPSARRTFVFVEDTTPPSSDTLKTAQLQVPMRPQPPTPPASPALRSSFTSPSNRQRAP